MELFFFIAFQLLMEVQTYEAPAVKVSPDVLRESSSVKMICETPAGVAVKQCHFYTNREQKNIKVIPSCELDLTGAEVLRWAAVNSSASVDISCFYTIHERGINKPSSHSPAVTVTVLGSLQKPFISVSDDEGSINIACEIPLSVRADFICSLYTEDGLFLHRRVSQTQRSQSGEHFCVFHLSHSDLFTQSVNSRQLSCDYFLSTEREVRSPRSDTHTVRDLPEANLTASASVILETDTVQLSCNNTEHLKMEMCVFNIYGRESNSKPSTSCQLSLTGSQISIWSEGQSSSVNITCFYTVIKSQDQKPSPHSDPVTITIKISKPDAHVTPAMTTSLPLMSTSETYSTSADPYSKSNLPTSTSEDTMFSTATPTQKVSRMDTKTSVVATFSTIETLTLTRTGLFVLMMVSAGVGVILSGLICLWFACQKRRQCNKMRSITSDEPSQGIGMCSGPAETYSLITSEPATSQPISVGVLVNKQQKEENKNENENVYHLYCTIPDEQVHSNAEDQVYSLVH